MLYGVPRPVIRGHECTINIKPRDSSIDRRDGLVSFSSQCLDLESIPIFPGREALWVLIDYTPTRLICLRVLVVSFRVRKQVQKLCTVHISTTVPAKLEDCPFISVYHARRSSARTSPRMLCNTIYIQNIT